MKGEINRILEILESAKDENGCIPMALVRQALKKLEQRWIPVSERLPEEPNMYTVTDSNGNVVRFVFYNNETSREYWRRCAKAWMPLPEPYKGGENTDAEV